MELVIPIFHTKFDPLQVSVMHFDYIPPIGDFGDFWWLLLVTSPEWSLWYQFFTQNLTLYISVKELNGLDQKLLQFLDAYISFKEPSGLDTSV